MSRAFFPLMSTSEVKNILPEINDNIPRELVDNNIKIAQQMKIRPVLGYGFYEELEGQVKNDTISVPNQYLFDEYLYMIIALQVQKRLIMTNSFQLENNGLRTKLSDVSDLAGTEDLTYYRSDLTNDIDFLVNEMTKYIDSKPGDYPLYITRTDPREDNNVRKYHYGFSLGKVENDRC